MSKEVVICFQKTLAINIVSGYNKSVNKEPVPQ